MNTSWYPVMLVVKTTSAAEGSPAVQMRPRKRVPSSSRRNPLSPSRGSTGNALRLRRRRLRCCSRRGSRRGSRWSVRLRGGRQRDRGGWARGRRLRCGRGGRRRIEDRSWHARARGHQLQHECEEDEDSAAPPGNSRQEIACLAHSDERLGGRAGATKCGCHSATLASLHEHGEGEDDAVNYQENEQERVHCDDVGGERRRPRPGSLAQSGARNL